MSRVSGDVCKNVFFGLSLECVAKRHILNSVKCRMQVFLTLLNTLQITSQKRFLDDRNFKLAPKKYFSFCILGQHQIRSPELSLLVLVSWRGKSTVPQQTCLASLLPLSLFILLPNVGYDVL